MNKGINYLFLFFIDFIFRAIMDLQENRTDGIETCQLTVFSPFLLTSFFDVIYLLQLMNQQWNIIISPKL